MTRLIDRLLRYPRLGLILVVFVVTEIVSLGVSHLLYLLDPESVLAADAAMSELLPASLIGQFIAMVLIAPMVETLMCQWFLLLLAKEFTRKIAKSDSWTPAFLISSLTFAGVHFFNYGDARLGLLHVAGVLFAAFAFSLVAILEREREGGNLIMVVFLMHAAHNLLVFVDDLLFQLPTG